MSKLLPSAIILAFVLAYLVVGFLTLDAASRLVPLLAAVVTAILLVIDILRIRLQGTEYRQISEHAEGGGVKLPEARGREFVAIGFVAGGVVAVYLVGFLVAIPVYLYASIAYLGQQSLRLAAIVAALASLSIYLVFDLALDYELYAGILFS